MTTPPKVIVTRAIKASLKSPCLSKRGAVVFKGSYVYSWGWNTKFKEFECTRDVICKKDCRRTALHAEQNAILCLGFRYAEGKELLHVKTVDGELVSSEAPSCIECSKLALAVGIKGVWLYHEDGWKRYPIAEFHELSLENGLRK